MFDSKNINSSLKHTLPDPTLPLRGDWSECIHSAFTQITKRSPQQIAIVADEIYLSYGEIDRISNRLANYLLTHDGKGRTVAVYSRRSPTLVWAILGILKAGAAFLILDAAYPHLRLAEYCRQAEPFIIFELESGFLPTEVTNGGRIPSLLLPKDVTIANQQLQSYSPDSPEISVNPHDLAYVAFTSGSTGRPKGILGNHAPVTHFIAWDIHTFNLNSADRFSMLSGLSHDVLLRDIFVPLSLGATLCVPNESDLSPGRLTDWLAKQQITIAHLTPSMGQFVIANHRLLKDLRYLFFGGDKLARTLVSKLCQQAPGVICVNFYGATETPQAMGFFIVSNHEHQQVEQKQAVLPIGCGIADTQLLILDANLQILDIGEVGEIAIRSPYLTRGYLNDETATQKKFISNPYTNQVNDLIYRTGDLGRYLPDGNVEFLGRIDDQVELRGYRIELGEIESTLNAHPSITQSKVILHRSPADEYLVSYFITSKSIPKSTNVLRAYLLARLPSYMVPSIFIQLEQFPLTPNGKIDTDALPLPQRLGATHEYNPPRTDHEKSLVTIWEEVLDVSPLGIDNNFFELGGHSLLAIRVIARVREIFAVELLLHHLLEFPTVVSLAEQISRMEPIKSQHISSVSHPPMHIPLSSAQQNFWTIENQSEQARAALNVVLTRLIVGRLNIEALRQSISEILRRHENLRTNFTLVKGQPYQIIHPQQAALLPIVKVQGLSEAEQIDKVSNSSSQELQLPFDLKNGFLWRATLYQLSQRKHILSLTFDHIIFDTLSSTVFMDELWTFYEAFQQNQPSPLTPLKIQYKDFSIWQHQQIQSKLREGLDYWKKYLSSELPILNLPYDFFVEKETFVSERLSRQLPIALSKHLKELSRCEGVTLFITLLTALKVLLIQFVNQDDILVGAAVSTRNSAELERMIGLFISALPLRTDLSGNPTFREALVRVRQATIDASRYQDISFQEVLNTLYPHLRMTFTEVFKVWINMVNETTGEIRSIGDITVENISLRQPSAKFDLGLYISDGTQVQLDLIYKQLLFSKTHIAEFLERYERLLEQIVSSPETRILENFL
jgi:amino acid adenylation domain-containing protein